MKFCICEYIIFQKEFENSLDYSLFAVRLCCINICFESSASCYGGLFPCQGNLFSSLPLFLLPLPPSVST